MKCFVLSEAVLLKNRRVYFSDICIKGSGNHGRQTGMGYTVRPTIIAISADSQFEDADHPFYTQVYEEAAKINLEFSNQLDACIIR